MATKKATTSRAAKMREHFHKFPTATPSEVAKRFGTTYQIAYMCKKDMEPKKIVLQRAEVEVANRLGVSTKEYAKQKAKILKAPKAKAVPLPKVGDSIGGLTLTRKEKEGGWVYTWVRDDVVKDNPLDTVNPEAITMVEPPNDPVNHPAHYKVGGVETIDFIEAKKLNYNMGNAVKYISRADHKGNKKQDLEKAKWYIDRELTRL